MSETRDAGEPSVEPPTLCLRCGKNLRPEVRFCPYCGMRVGEQAPPLAAETQLSPLQIIRQIDSDSRQIVNIIILYVLWICTSIVASIAADSTGNTTIVILATEVCDGILTIVWLLIFHRGVLALYGRSSLLCGKTKYFVVLLGAFPLFLIIQCFVSFLTQTFSIESESLTDCYTLEGYGMVVVVLSISFQPALIEELAFRGIMQTTLSKYMGKIEALVVASAGFAILHLSPVSFAHLFLLGVYLGLLREWSQGLYVPMLAHFLHNALCILQEYYHIVPL